MSPRNTRLRPSYGAAGAKGYETFEGVRAAGALVSEKVRI